MTVSREQELATGIRRFIATRGRHEGEHVYCCENGGRCRLCEESYVVAEGALDALVNRPLSGAPAVVGLDASTSRAHSGAPTPAAALAVLEQAIAALTRAKGYARNCGAINGEDEIDAAIGNLCVYMRGLL